MCAGGKFTDCHTQSQHGYEKIKQTPTQLNLVRKVGWLFGPHQFYNSLPNNVIGVFSQRMINAAWCVVQHSCERTIYFAGA